MTSLFENLSLPLPGASADPSGDAAAEAAAARRRAEADALLEGLNPQQREAVLHQGGPLLIVAGAGSGKTRVLTHRIAYLLATRRARAGEVLAITFTNKAAAEMRERVEGLVGPAAGRMWVSTFHSACVRILRREAATLGLRSSFSIYDSADSQRLLTLVARELDLDPKRYPAKALANKISSLKDELVDPETFAATSGGGAANDFDTALAQVYTRYQARLQAGARARLRRPDHDHRAPAAGVPGRRRALPAPVPARAGRRVPGHQPRAVRAGARAGRARSRGIVDDSTDMELPRGELTVVGDADQSIYAFRGASIRNILEFEADYPDARTILLEQNYRSTQTILSAANAVISRNPGREPKRLWTDSGRGRADRRVRRGHRARGGAVRRGGDRPAGRLRRRAARRRRGVLPRERAVPGARGGAHPRRPAVQGGRRHPVLRAQGDQGRGRVPARARQPRRRRQPAPHPQRAQARAGGPVGGDGRRRSPSASASRSARRSTGSTRSPAWARARSPACRRSRR